MVSAFQDKKSFQKSNPNDFYLIKIKKINDFLTRAAILFCLYLISYPFFPEVNFLYKMHIRTLFVVELVPDIKTAQAYETNRIFIPEIGVNEEIIETDSIKNVHDKVWHRPDTGTPPLGGNTVMVAHRYANIGGDRASTFYDLPKLKPNDVVTIWWEGVEYKYSVFETEIVEPDNVGVEAPTQESILTLYTCTPLWSATHRYVVRAKLIN